MKKILFAIAALVAFASCQKADLAEQNTININGERVITAYFDNAQTKTTLDGLTPNWASGDKIMLLDDTDKQEITLGVEGVISSDSKSVTFTTRLEGTLYAVYPSTATSAVKIETENIVPITLSAESQDGTFGSANICVAKENDGSLAFKNVTSVLHLTQDATTTKVNEIIITTPSEPIAGTGTVDMSAATPALTLSSGLSQKIKVKSASVKSNYYIAVAPTTLPVGTAFGFATGSKLGGTNLSEAKTIAPNTIYDIGSMDVSAISPNTYHAYVEINGLKWATMNIGANSATEAGYYFAWGYTDGCVRNAQNNGWVLAPNNTTAKQFNTTDFPDCDNSNFQDAATANWGGSWRMPTGGTSGEFMALLNATYWDYNNDSGYYVFSPVSGDEGGYNKKKADKSTPVSGSYETSNALLFFPCACEGEGSSISSGNNGYYWSSTSVSSNYAFDLYFTANTLNGAAGRVLSHGLTVRAVSD